MKNFDKFLNKTLIEFGYGQFTVGSLFYLLGIIGAILFLFKSINKAYE